MDTTDLDMETTDEANEMERRSRRFRYLGYNSRVELLANLFKDDGETSENDDRLFDDIQIVSDNEYAEASNENKGVDQQIAPPLSPTSEMNSKVKKILEQFKHEPKQTKLTSFFKSVQKYSSKKNKISKPIVRNHATKQIAKKDSNGSHRERKITFIADGYDWDTHLDDDLLSTVLEGVEPPVGSASNVITIAVDQPAPNASNVDNVTQC